MCTPAYLATTAANVARAAFWRRLTEQLIDRAALAMLISTKIFRQYSERTQVVREWRVVEIPEEDAQITDISTFYTRILDHVYDPLEPFRPLETDQDTPICAEIGSSQSSADFQGIPVTVCIADTVSQFGLYFKLYILHENEEARSLVTA